MLYNRLPNKITKIFLDLDEVLVDFVSSAYSLMCKVHFNPATKDYIDFIDKFNLNEDYRTESWAKIKNEGPDWWTNLPKLEWADELWATANAACGTVAVLTAPGRLPEAASGKWQWAKNGIGRKNIILAGSKHLVASPGAILIDDRDKYITSWEEAGGIGIQLRRNWSSSGYFPEEIIYALKQYINKNKKLSIQNNRK